MLTAIVAIVIPVFAALLVARHLSASRVPRLPVVVVVVALAAIGSAIVAKDVAAPGDPIASGTLGKDGSLDLPSVTGATVIIVDGAFDPAEQGAANGDYAIDVAADGKSLTTINGHFEEHTESRRMGRRGHAQVLVTHTERTHALPPEAVGKAVTLKLTDETGPISGPIHVLLRSADPPLRLMAGVAVLLVLALLVLLRGQLRKVAFPPVFGIVAAFVYSALLENGAHPPSVSGVFVLAVGAAMIGAAIAAVITLLPVFAKTVRMADAASLS